jgi:predicted porin
MKKNLIALAVLGALSVSAQAQSNVSLYGIVDVSMRHDTDFSTSGSRTAQVSGMLNTSRWGLRGTEDLGSDLKAHFTLEGGINPDTGTQSEALSLFDRRAFVGLSGSWGKIDIGRTPTFGWDFTPVYDPLGGALATPTPTSRAPGRAALLVNGMLFITNNPYNNSKLRDNSIKYVYNHAASGLSAGAAYNVGEVPGDSKKRSGYQGMVSYAKGPANAIVAYDLLHDANNLEQQVVTVGGNYKVASTLKATLGYAVLTADAAFAPSSNVVSGAMANYISTFGVRAGGEIEVATAAAGLEYQLAPAWSLTGAVYNTRVSGDGIATDDYKTFALLAKYAFSKRTTFYAALDHERTSGNSTVATTSGERSNSAVTAGVQMRF